MDTISRQTFLYLALNKVLMKHNISTSVTTLQDLLANIIREKIQNQLEQFETQESKSTEQKEERYIFKAQQVLQSQYPIGEEKNSRMKFCNTIYNLELPKTFQKFIKIPKNSICMLQLYSDNTLNKKPTQQQKQQKKPSKKNILKEIKKQKEEEIQQPFQLQQVTQSNHNEININDLFKKQNKTKRKKKTVEQCRQQLKKRDRKRSSEFKDHGGSPVKKKKLY